MKKLLLALSIVVFSACSNETDQVKPIDQVTEIEKSMWMAEDLSRMEFIPEINEMLVYGRPSPMPSSDSEDLPLPTAFTYYLQNNGTAKINCDHMTYKLEDHSLTIGDNAFTKIGRENTNVKNPMKGAKNKLWSKVVKGRYAVMFYNDGDSDVSLAFVKEKALVIMRHTENESTQARRFNFRDDKLYLGNPEEEVGFHLEVYNDDKVILRPDDGTEDLMFLYPVLH